MEAPKGQMDLDPKITQIAQELLELRKKPLLVLSLETVFPNVVFDVENELKGKNFDELDVVLHTNGGHIESAFNIAKLIRLHAKKVNMMIPAYAKSAGTLISLAGNKIIMGSIAELGPLDVQIKEVDEGNGSTYKSALNGFKALEQIRLHALENLDIATKMIIERTDGGMKLYDTIRLGIEFSGQTSGCLYNQLNPKYIGEYARALEIGERYAVIILTRYMGWSQDKARNVAKKLVYKYPSHGFIIDREELASLGFVAKEVKASENEKIDALKILLMQKEIHGQSFVKLFELKEENKLKNSNKSTNKKK